MAGARRCCASCCWWVCCVAVVVVAVYIDGTRAQQSETIYVSVGGSGTRDGTLSDPMDALTLGFT